MSQSKRKASKGSVGIESIKGRLRLRLPRQLFGGKQKYLTLGFPDKPEYRKFAELKVRQIEMDILTEQFDPTFEKYKPRSHRAQPEITIQPKIDLKELWQRFTAFKSPSISQSTLATDYEKTKHLISALPTKSLNDAVRIRDIVLSTHTSNAQSDTSLNYRLVASGLFDLTLLSSIPLKAWQRR